MHPADGHHNSAAADGLISAAADGGPTSAAADDLTSAAAEGGPRSADAEFVAFVRASSDSLHRTAYLLTGNRDAAQDAVQSALARVYQAWPRRRDWIGREAYARQVLVNVVLTSRRRRWWGELPRADIPERLVSSSPDASAVAGDRDVLRRALDHLPPRQRTAVVLRHYLDLSEIETAAEMGCPVGTVKSLTARALTALRGHLEEAAS